MKRGARPVKGGKAGRNRGGSSRQQDHLVLTQIPMQTDKSVFFFSWLQIPGDSIYVDFMVHPVTCFVNMNMCSCNAATARQQAVCQTEMSTSKLELRFGFADEVSPNKVCSSQLVSYHASHSINSAAANNDTIEHLVRWLIPRLQVEYHQHIIRGPGLVSSWTQCSLQFSSFTALSPTHLIGWQRILVNQLKDSFVDVLKECSSVCFVWL